MSRNDAHEEWIGPLPAAPGCDCQICRPEAEYDAMDRQAIDTVLQHGWQVMLVSDEVECHDPEHDHAAHDQPEASPIFAYTIGLGHRCAHPELLISGLDPKLMHTVLNGLAQRVMGGLRLEPGDAVENALGGVPVAIEEVAPDALEETLGWSGWFHRHVPEGLAIVWPTTSGIFAWQPGAPEELDTLQPPRWRVSIQHDGGLAPDPDWPFPVPPDLRAFSCMHVVDEGAPVLWAAREQDDDRGEDWSAHCGEGHSTGEIRVVHLAHLVRSAPSLRALSDLTKGEEALRDDPDSDWVRTPIQE